MYILYAREKRERIAKLQISLISGDEVASYDLTVVKFCHL